MTIVKKKDTPVDSRFLIVSAEWWMYLCCIFLAVICIVLFLSFLFLTLFVWKCVSFVWKVLFFCFNDVILRNYSDWNFDIVGVVASNTLFLWVLLAIVKSHRHRTTPFFLPCGVLILTRSAESQSASHKAMGRIRVNRRQMWKINPAIREYWIRYWTDSSKKQTQI